MSTKRFCHSPPVLLVLLFIVTLEAPVLGQGDPLGHRKSNLTIFVEDANGNAITDATLGVRMTQHAFKFGTQVRDRLFSITQTEFDSLTTTQQQNLLPDLTQFGQPRYTPVWQDVVNYQDAVVNNFNHVVPTTGMQWIAYNNNGPTVPDAAINKAQSFGLGVTGASVVWQRDQWPTPTQFRSAANPDAQTFHDALIADRLSSTGIMGRYSSSGAGPNITDWKVLNEPLHQSYYADTFVNAGIYANETEALADYFIRANAVRPDATLSINEFNILNSGSDADVIAYRDLINNLLTAGAPIDRIGVQAHMSRNDVTKSDMTRRLNILAETGLGIEITEFDTRDDAGQLTPAEQERIFQDLLEASFENESVDAFIMWGFWDPGHWRGNGPLFDEDWNVKDEASPWNDLVQGDWMPDLMGLTLDSEGKWIAPDGLFDGTYELVASRNGQMTVVDGYVLNADGQFTIVVVPEPNALAAIFSLLVLACCRRRRFQHNTVQ